MDQYSAVRSTTDRVPRNPNITEAFGSGNSHERGRAFADWMPLLTPYNQ